MNYKLASELSTILFSIQQGQAKLDMFLAKNKEQLIEMGIHESLNNAFLDIENGTSKMGEHY